MGCNKICKAKKKAAAAKKEAEAAQRDADVQKKAAEKQAAAAMATAGEYSADITVTSYSVEVVTVAKYLGIDKKKNALSIREMEVLLRTAGRSPEILANAAVKNLINPIATAMGAYKVLDAGRKAWLIVKPAVKIAQQINDAATCNFAAIVEMIADVGLFILQILIGFAPLLIEILKNLFLDIPLYTKIITKEQSIRIQKLITLSQVNIQERIADVFSSFTIKEQLCPSVVDALAAIRVVEAAINVAIQTYTHKTVPIPTLESLTDVPVLWDKIVIYIIAGLECARKTVLQQSIEEVNKEEIDILQIPDVQNADVVDKKAMKDMMEGLLTVTKKVELAEAEELLRRNFVASQSTPTEEGERFADSALAESAADLIIQALRDMLVFAINAFNDSDGSIHPALNLGSASTKILNEEIKKNLDKVQSTREDIIILNIVEELMQSNKIQILKNIIESLNNISFDPSIFDLNDCISLNINNDFNTLRATMIADNFTTIDNAVITDTAEMIALKDLVLADTVQAINDELIEVNDTCGFANEVCESVEFFKSDLVLQIDKNLSEMSINIAMADVPDYVEKYKLKKMVDLFNNEINKEIGLAARTIVLEDLLPCKSCKPCEQITTELFASAGTMIEKIKDEMILNVNNNILNEPVGSWTITDAQSIIDAKQLLVDISGAGITANAGVVDLYDAFIYRLKLEEEELLNSINRIIKNL